MSLAVAGCVGYHWAKAELGEVASEGAGLTLKVVVYMALVNVLVPCIGRCNALETPLWCCVRPMFTVAPCTKSGAWGEQGRAVAGRHWL